MIVRASVFLVIVCGSQVVQYGTRRHPTVRSSIAAYPCITIQALHGYPMCFKGTLVLMVCVLAILDDY